MTTADTQAPLRLDGIPSEGRAVFGEFAELLRRLAGENLLGLSAFGGWLSGDAFFADAPAQSVAVFHRVDLETLDRLASAGTRLGQAHLMAPLTMTPAHIASSTDVFPLELLEIQRLHVCVLGADHFASLTVNAADVRLQCERELKGALVQLRQGLLASAGERAHLIRIGRAAISVLNRVLIGLAWLREPTAGPRTLHALLDAAESFTALNLPAIRAVIDGAPGLTFDRFSRLYADFDGLTAWVDRHAT